MTRNYTWSAHGSSGCILMILCVNWLLVLGLKSLHIFKTKQMCPFHISQPYSALGMTTYLKMVLEVRVFRFSGCMQLLHILRRVPPKSATCFLYEKMCWQIFVTCNTKMGVLIHNLNLLLVHMERMFRMTFVWTIAYNNRTFDSVILKSPFHSIVVT